MPGQQMQFWQNNSAVDCCWMHQDCGFGFQLPFWCPSNGDEMTERAVLNYFSKQFSATAGLGQLWEFANSIMNFVFMTRSKFVEQTILSLCSGCIGQLDLPLLCLQTSH